MKELTLSAYAKVNLSIDVQRKREDGYHEVSMVMHQIDLHDSVTVSLDPSMEPGSIALECDEPSLPGDERNLAWRAAALMQSGYREAEGVGIRIRIVKRIPAGAGLGGGSADGAAVLHALSHLLGLSLSLAELSNLGMKLGADVPFCLMGQASLNQELGFDQGSVSSCALAGGIGEKLAPLPTLPAYVVLSKPPISVSTAEVYGALRISDIKNRPDNARIMEGLKEGNFYKITSNMANVLETVSEMSYPQIVYTKNIMQPTEGQYRILMSGSGPTVFAITQDNSLAEKMYQQAKGYNAETFLTRTL